MIFLWENVVKPLETNKTSKRRYSVKCNHGRQNHEEEFRDAARKNEQQSQKRDADFG